MAWLGEIRALHILAAAAWFGAATFLTLYLMPAVRQLGPQGGPVMAALAQRRFDRFMAASAMLTVLSGGWMYWALTGGLQPAAIASRDGLVYGVGGLCGLLAAVIGGVVVGRSSKQLAALVVAGGAPDPARIARLQARIRTGSRLALMLMLVALLAMTLAHAA
ncbi:MAG: hypothetical protein HOQ02_09535 [Lysobacter sp.]|nr:hypothetical protein [Lysobacter sp.]